MWTTIATAARPVGRVSLLTTAALAVGLLGPAEAFAAPPAPATLMSGVVGQSSYGTIKGRLVWAGGEVPPVRALEEQGKAKKDPNVCAKDKTIYSRELVVDPETKGVQYGFAYITRPKGTNPEAVKELIAAKPKVEIDQVNCEFLPYATPIHKDQALVVKASDPGINHNVHLSPLTNAGLNQTVNAGGALEIRLEPERLPIPVKCDIHPWMNCWIMVFDHPFFATTGKDGSFEIKGVPAGTQNLVVWQERVGFANPGIGRGMPVTVKAGEVTDVGEVKLVPKAKP